MAPSSAPVGGAGVPSYRYDVFVSYSPADEPWALDWLVPRLQGAGLRVCTDQDDCFEPGATRLDNSQRAVAESRRVLALLSPDWVADRWASFETQLAQDQDPNAHWRRLIPLLVRPCEPPDSIRRLQWVDFTRPDRQDAQLRRVVAAVQGVTALPELRPDLFPEPAVRHRELRLLGILVPLVFLLLLAVLGPPAYRLWQQTHAAMPGGQFNIAIAQFATLGLDGRPLRGSREGLDQARSVADYVSGQADTIRQVISGTLDIWGPDRVGAIPDGAEEARAAALNANVLLYGYVQQLPGGDWELQPALYLSPTVAQQAAELSGTHTLGAPMPYSADSIGPAGQKNVILTARLRAIVHLLEGLSWYSWSSHRVEAEPVQTIERAVAAFTIAAQDPNWGAAPQPMGQEVVYLFLGNAYASEAGYLDAQPVTRTQKLEAGRQSFAQAITLNSAYARSYNGLAALEYEAARPLRPVRNPCLWNWDRLAQAEQNFQAALAVPAAGKPASGDVDLRAHLGLGRVNYVRGLCPQVAGPAAPGAWDRALAEYSRVIAAYTAGGPDQLRRRKPALIAYHESGLIVLQRAIAQNPRPPRLLDEAIQDLGPAVRLAEELQAEDNTVDATVFVPWLLTAYCLNGQPAAARTAVAAYATAGARYGGAAGPSAVITRVPDLTREGCLP